MKAKNSKAETETREILVPHFEGEKFTPPSFALLSAVVSCSTSRLIPMACGAFCRLLSALSILRRLRDARAWRS